MCISIAQMPFATKFRLDAWQPAERDSAGELPERRRRGTSHMEKAADGVLLQMQMQHRLQPAHEPMASYLGGYYASNIGYIRTAT